MIRLPMFLSLPARRRIRDPSQSGDVKGNQNFFMFSWKFASCYYPSQSIEALESFGQILNCIEGDVCSAYFTGVGFLV